MKKINNLSTLAHTNVGQGWVFNPVLRPGPG